MLKHSLGGLLHNYANNTFLITVVDLLVHIYLYNLVCNAVAAAMQIR